MKPAMTRPSSDSTVPPVPAAFLVRSAAVASLAAALLVGGCVNGLEYQAVRADAPDRPLPAESTATLPAGADWKLRLRIQRPSYVYVVEESPDGRLRTLLPSPAVQNSADYFEKGQVVELPAESPGRAPAKVILVVAEMRLGHLSALLAGGGGAKGVNDPPSVRRSLERLRDLNPNRPVNVETRDGWTEVSIRQFGVDDVVYRTLEFGTSPAAAPAPAPSTPAPSPK
jgi:hypothetical protein